MRSPWPPPWPAPRYRWPSSIRARSATSPGRPGSWPRPTRSMPASSPFLRRRCAQRPAPCPMRKPPRWANSSPGRQLVDMLGAEHNRRRLLRDRRLQRHLEAHIAWLEEALRRLDHDLTTLIRSTPVWRETDDLLRSVPGIGPVTAGTLIADLPERGRLDPRRIAALGGLAPIARDR